MSRGMVSLLVASCSTLSFGILDASESQMKPRTYLLITLLLLNGCSGNPSAGPASRDDIGALDSLRQSDPGRGVIELKRHLKSKPRDDLAWTMLGHAYEDLEQDDEAEAAYRKALDIDPQRFDALTGMGILCRKSSKYDQAMEYYEKAIAINPRWGNAYSSMTVISLKQGKDAKALEYAKKGYDLDKTDPVAIANLAVAYHYNGMAELRDEMTEEAKSLGYKNVDSLHKIYSGELTVRD